VLFDMRASRTRHPRNKAGCVTGKVTTILSSKASLTAWLSVRDLRGLQTH
jgi:hypothetical protein